MKLSDFVECVDCHRRLADPPAKFCIQCQLPRFKAMRDLYDGTAPRGEAVTEQKKLF